MTEPQITQVNIDTLLPYANNAREHTEEQVAQVASATRWNSRQNIAIQ